MDVTASAATDATDSQDLSRFLISHQSPWGWSPTNGQRPPSLADPGRLGQLAQDRTPRWSPSARCRQPNLVWLSGAGEPGTTLPAGRSAGFATGCPVGRQFPRSENRSRHTAAWSVRPPRYWRPLSTKGL